jgi:hypothetical protein
MDDIILDIGEGLLERPLKEAEGATRQCVKNHEECISPTCELTNKPAIVTSAEDTRLLGQR